MNNDSKIDINDFQSDGISFEIADTYNSANVDGAIDSFIKGDYFNDDGTLDMNRIVSNYQEYDYMFINIDDDITLFFINA